MNKLPDADKLFSQWADEIVGYDPDRLLQEAITMLAPQDVSTLPDYLHMVPIITCLALSGKDFSDLYVNPRVTASYFLHDIRCSYVAAMKSKNNGVDAPLDGSEFDARRGLERMLNGRNFESDLRDCLTELALSTCDLTALAGILGLQRDGVDEQKLERAFLDKVAKVFVDTHGPLRTFTFQPRLSMELKV